MLLSSADTTKSRPMIRFFIFVLIVIASGTSAVHAQGFYFKAGIGAHKGIEAMRYSNLAKPLPPTAKYIKVFPGNAYTAAFSAGYKFNKNLGCELDLAYHFLFEDVQFVTLAGLNGYRPSTFRAIPSLVMATELKKLTLYSKLGAILATGKIDTWLFQYSTGIDYITSYTYKNPLSIGALASIGVNYPFKNNFSLYGEIALNVLTLAPKTRTMTAYTKDGEDLHHTLSTAQKETEYYDEIPNSAAYSPNEPTLSLKTYMPMSSVGLQLGLRYDLR